MQIPLTPQLLGDLIEKGYTYMLADTDAETAADVTILLKPVREKPDLTRLPEGYNTYYKITQEPMQLACNISDTTVMVAYETLNDNITSGDIFEDSYFRMSETFFRQVLDSLEDYAVFTTDKNGDVNSWNTGAERVLGYQENEVTGCSAKLFFTPEDNAIGAAEQELASALQNGRAIDERYHVCKDGTRFWGSGLVFPLHDEEGTHRGFTKVMRNLHERQHAELQAEEH